MISNLKYFLLSFFLVACFSKQDEKTKSKEINKTFQSYNLDTVKGYRVNPFSGDSIKPLINSKGELVKTGVVLPLTCVEYKRGDFYKEYNGQLKNPIELPLHAGQNVDFLKALKISIDTGVLPKVLINQNTEHLVVNGIGDTLKTGQPIPFNGKKKPFVFPKAVQAKSLQISSNSLVNFQHLDFGQGINSSYVRSVTQDKSGSLWFGYDIGGVTKYDGSNIWNFTSPRELLLGSVFSIATDTCDNIWISCYGVGLFCFNGHDFVLYDLHAGLLDKMVTNLFVDSKNNIWIGYDREGLSKISGNTITHFLSSEGLSRGNITSINEDKKGNIWLGTLNGMQIFNGKSFKSINMVNGLKSPWVSSLVFDSKDNLWFVNDLSGIIRFDGKEMVLVGKEYGLDKGVSNLLIDNRDNLWISSSNGIYQLSENRLINYSQNSGLPGNIISKSKQDLDGNIWFCVEGNGLVKFSDNGISYLSKNLDQGNIIYNVSKGKGDDVWYCPNTGGITQVKNNASYIYNNNTGLPTYAAKQVFKDSKNNIWIASAGNGLIRITDDKFIQFKSDVDFAFNNINFVCEDYKGNIWFVILNKGLMKFDGTKFWYFSDQTGLSSKMINFIYEDRRKNIWLGTGGSGVSRISNGKITHFTEKEGLFVNGVSTIIEDAKGDLWFATVGSGICKFDGKSFKYINENNGLSSNIVWALASYKDDELCAATERGLSIIESNNEKYKIKKVELADGLKAHDIWPNSLVFDNAGKLWCGTGKGVAIVDIAKFNKQKNISAAVITQLSIGEKFYDFSVEQNSLNKKGINYRKIKKFKNLPEDLELSYENNHLTFYFSAIDISSPHKLRYQYKIDGIDNGWSEITDKTYADYRNLAYGTFVFNVRCYGENLEWSKITKYTFTIFPPWWLTVWFKITVLIISFYLIVLLFRWRTRLLRRRKNELEGLVKIRTAEVVEEKSIVEKQKQLIEAKQKEIIDSIHYAKRIQQALLPSMKYFERIFKNRKQ